MRSTILLVVAVVAAGAFSGPASADFSVDLVTEFSEATPPAGAPPWLRASFTDGTGSDAGDVFLHLQDVGLTGTEFVSGWYFNFDDSMDLLNLSVGFESGNANNDLQNLLVSENDLKADGDGKYDFSLGWNNPSLGSNFFNVGADATFRLSSTTEALTADAFMFLSQPAGGHGPFVTAAHVQSIGSTGESGWVTGTVAVVPAPGAAILGAMGLGLVGWLRRFTR